VFTSDGHNPLGDAKRLHRLRRSFCKSWRNDKWRDLLLAFWYWLADGAAFIDAPMGEGAVLRLRLSPMVLDAPFGIDTPDDRAETPDDDEETEAPEGEPGEEGNDDDPEDLDETP